MNKLKYVLILLVSILVVKQTLQAVEVDELLLDRLVEKGTLTQEEAATIRAEAAIKTQEEVAQKKKKFNVEGKTKFDIGGYIQGQYAIDETSGKFNEFKVRRVYLDFRGDISKKIGWRFQGDFIQTLKTVTESVTVTQDSKTKNVTTKSTTTRAVVRPILLDAYFEYKPYSFANFRLGQFSIPFGRENLESNATMDTINRSQVTESLVPGRDIGSQGRDIGGQLSGVFDFERERKIIEYAIGVFNGAGINTGDDNEYKDVAGRLLIFPVQNLVLGVSHYYGKSGATRITKKRVGGELTYTIKNLSLKSEVVSGEDVPTTKIGWYAQTGYKFIPQLEIVFKYDSYDTNKTNDRTDVATPGINWFINKWAKLQANYEWKIEEGTSIDNNIFTTQFQVQF